ncbi:Enkurin domain [Trypanosoma melophagium]|uniref:Enkurin domain n=1 Tax=Trypanosoma melophagium TaxID=715481 RepID=UPI00351A7293|nr:Enkurin domain [Trypanosoma melophagium]
MSKESIYNLVNAEVPVDEGPYTGKYEKHMKELPKPTYSTFYERNKEYDGTFPRYFKQRDAIIGPIVNESVDPKNFLRAGEGVKHSVPAVREEKIFTKPPLDPRARNPRGGDEINKGMPDGLDKGAGGEGDYLGKDKGIKNEYGEGQPSTSKDLENGDTNDGLYGPGALDGKKDFVTSNIIQVSNMVPKRRKDQPENLTSRKTFGQVPPYLSRVKKEIEEEKMHFKNIEDAQAQQKIKLWERNVYRLDERERLDLIEKLTTKLKQKSGEMNKMPFVKDTFAQVKRRSDLERGMKEIEAALGKLDKDAVFVYNDNPRCVHWTKDAALQEATRFASQPSH